MKIYSGIERIERDEPDYNNYDSKAEQAKDQEYIDKIVAYAKSKNKGEYVGKELAVPYADGYARYIVLSEKPMSLIHLDIGDGWDDPNISYMTVKGVKETIDRQESFSKMWSKQKEKAEV